jgi:hypothetical protein
MVPQKLIKYFKSRRKFPCKRMLSVWFKHTGNKYHVLSDIATFTKVGTCRITASIFARWPPFYQGLCHMVWPCMKNWSLGREFAIAKQIRWSVSYLVRKCDSWLRICSNFRYRCTANKQQRSCRLCVAAARLAWPVARANTNITRSQVPRSCWLAIFVWLQVHTTGKQRDIHVGCQ